MDADCHQLIEVFSRCLPRVTDDATFDWLYRRNPHGPPRVWLALDDGKVVGAVAAFARCFVIDGERMPAWVLGDFCIVPEHRSLGPALTLQRACLAGIGHDAAVWYDFPSPVMLGVYRRLGITPSTTMIRFMRPLRSQAVIRSIVKSTLLARSLGAPLDVALFLRSRVRRRDRSLTVALHEGPCEDEFSRLAHGASGRLRACVERSAAYLNWRYRANPLYRCEFLTARRGAELLAYAVFVDDGRDGLVVDLFGVDDSTVLGALLDGLADLLRKRGRRAVATTMLVTHPWLEVLRVHGFVARDSQPVVIHTPGRSGSRHLDGRDLHLIHGDRDS